MNSQIKVIDEQPKKKKTIIIKKKKVAKPVMKAEAEDFKQLFGDKFIYCGIHLKTEGFKADGKPRKKATFPVGYDKVEKPTIEIFKSKGKDIIPNGIILLQESSNYSSIDVDIPEECDILEQLFKDCNQIHKTKNGFHFIFKHNDLPRSNCGIVDINTNLFFVPEYRNEYNEVIGNYEIIKNEGLIDISEYAYKYCEKLIYCKMNKSPKSTTDKSSIINYTEREVNELFNLDIMNSLYKIYYDKGYMNKYDTWKRVLWVGRHLNNSDEGFKLFLKYSRMAKGYEKEPEEDIKKQFFQKNQYDRNFNELAILYNARKLSKEKYIKEIDPILHGNKFLKHCITFNSKYIYTEENKEIFDEFITKDEEILAISSPYGTGKTYTFKKLIPNFKKRSKEIQALCEEIQRDPGLIVKRSKEIQALREEIQRDPGLA